MIASTHLAVGAAAGLAAQECLLSDASNPEKLFWAFAAGLVSHIILDALPHKEYTIDGLRLWLVLLAETGVVFALALSLQNGLLLNSLIFFGMAGGALPDVIELVYINMFNWPGLGSIGQMIHLFHFRSALSKPGLSYYTQILIAVVAIVFVKLKSV